MGFNVMRFASKIEPEYVCSICKGVLMRPLQITPCQHLFCRNCLVDYVASNHHCPIDKRAITFADITRAPRIIVNLIMHLKIECDNMDLGCNEIVALEKLNVHRSNCVYNQNKLYKCSFGCDDFFTADNLRKHTCLTIIPHSCDNKPELKQNMKMSINFQLKRIKNYYEIFEIVDQSITQQSQQNKFVVKAISDRQSLNMLKKWALTLPKAKISKWSVLIFNAGNGTTIKNALMEANCPTNLVFDLVKCSLPSYWPYIFQSIAERRKNLLLFKELIFRRLPEQQIAIFFCFDNPFLTKEMAAIFYFACGVKNKI